jgi:hypothetical protein
MYVEGCVDVRKKACVCKISYFDEAAHDYVLQSVHILKYYLLSPPAFPSQTSGGFFPNMCRSASGSWSVTSYGSPLAGTWLQAEFA